MKKSICSALVLLLIGCSSSGVDSAPLTLNNNVVHGYRLDTPAAGDGFTVTVPDKWAIYADKDGTRQKEGSVYRYGMIANVSFSKPDHVDPDTLAIYTVDVAKNGKSFDTLVKPLEYDEAKIQKVITDTNAGKQNSLERKDIILETKDDTIGGMKTVINTKKCLKACTPAGVTSTNVQYFIDDDDYILIFIVGTETSKMTDQLLADADKVIRSVNVVQ